jgi:hypothetical protein
LQDIDGKLCEWPYAIMYVSRRILCIASLLAV